MCPAARYAGRHPKTFETALGPLTLERAYYHCRPCGKGWFPRDQALGMAGTSLSPAVTRMIGSAAAVASFATASNLLDELAAVRVNAKRVERVAEALGHEMAAAERAAVFAPEPPAAPTMYLGVDGTGVPMRPSEVAGRAGKQSDGSAATREAKLVVIWTAEQCDQHGLPACDEGSVTYSAAIDSAAARDTDQTPAVFTQRLRREAERRGFPQAACQVFLDDGVKWIWGAATEMCPNAIQVVDFFHVSEKLWAVAKALFPADRDSVQTCAEARCEELKAGALDCVLATLRAHAGHCVEAAKAAHYIATNRERMRYAEFPRPRLADRLRCGRGGLQGGRGSPQAVRHALDQGRSRGDPHPARLHSGRTLRGILGLANAVTGPGGRLTANRRLAGAEPRLQPGRTSCRGSRRALDIRCKIPSPPAAPP